jgi:hypothetical protein
MSSTTFKGVVANFLLFSVSFLIIYCVAEIIVRSYFKDDASLFPRYHTDARYGDYTLRSLRPNSEFWYTSLDGTWKTTTNSKGLRNDREFSYVKPKDVVRVLTLGDSHTQGYEVRQGFTYSKIIEKQLKKKGVNAEVINTGVSGFSTAEELLYLENEGYKYKPDYVVLGFFANDYEDNLKSGLFKLNEDGSLSIEKYEHIPGVKIQNFIYAIPLVKWMSENSYFYSLLFNKTWLVFKLLLARAAANDAVEFAVPTNNVSSDYGSALTMSLIKRMSDFTKKRNIGLIIMDIPLMSEDGKFESSVSSRKDKQAMIENSDDFVAGYTLLEKYDGVAELHVPHGLKHISEFTHTMRGISAANKIHQLSQ